MKTNYKNKKEAIKGYGIKLSINERSDCVVCAMAAVLNITYSKAHKFVGERYGRKDKRGTFNFVWLTNKIVDSEDVLFGKRIVKHEPLSYKGEKCKTVGQFLKSYKYRKGTFILVVRNHVFTIKNGIVIGNWDDSTKLRTRLDKVYQIINQK